VILGGAAVHRCDNWLISEPALQFAEKLGFVSLFERAASAAPYLAAEVS
jgi:hypothetical protein